MKRDATIVAVLLAAAALPAANGCGTKKVSECNSLVQAINAGVKNIETQPNDPSGAADLRAMADSMEKVAADASKIELTIPELQKYSTEYQALAKDVAKTARELAAAAEAKDMAKVTVARAAMDRAIKQEDSLVESINKFCQAP